MKRSVGIFASIGVTLAVTAALVTSACVGEDPDITPSTKADGERGGRCFANGTCLGGGLACIDNVCVLPGDVGPDAQADGALIDAPSSGDGATADAGVDAASAADCGALPTRHSTGEVQCNGPTTAFCPLNTGCCTDPGQCQQANACVGGPHYGCQGPADCASINGECCLVTSGTPVVSSGCPAPVTSFAGTKCVARNSCVNMNPQGRVTCTASDPCDSGKTCKAVDVQVGVAANNTAKTFKLAVCVP